MVDAMDLPNTLRIRDLSALTGAFAALVTVFLLLTSGTATQEVLAASGLVEEFVDEGAEVQVNFTKIGGESNTDYSIRLPKQSNVLEAGLNLTGEHIFKTNQVQTYKSAYDFR